MQDSPLAVARVGLLSSCQAPASLVAEHRLSRVCLSVVAPPGLGSTGSVVVLRRLTCSVAGGDFPDQGSNQCLLH